MSFNESIKSSHKTAPSRSDVYNDVTKSIQLLLSGAPLLLLSKTSEGYSNPLLSDTFAKPAIKILALDEQNGKYFIVDEILYDLVLGKGKSPSRAEIDRQILSYITGSEGCPKLDSWRHEKVEALRMEYVTKIDDLKREIR